MISVSIRTLKILAALLWYIGAVVLLAKGCVLLGEAYAMRPGYEWMIIAVITGIIAGVLKVRYLFINSCKKNIRRIEELKQPRIWQFYTPSFFFFLAIMVLAGVSLSRMATGSYPFLMGLATLDITLATALLGSSYLFWKVSGKDKK